MLYSYQIFLFWNAKDHIGGEARIEELLRLLEYLEHTPWMRKAD